MQFKLYLFCLCLIIFFIKCNNRKADKIEKKVDFRIDVYKDSLSSIKRLFLSDITNDHKIIKLETRNDNIIGSVSKIYLSDSKIYLLDNKSNQSIFVFSIQGNFLFKINNKGRGPFEYNQIDDFMFDENKKELILLDTQTKKLVYYDHIGRPIREQILPFYADYFEILNKDFLVFLGSSKEDRVIVWDSEKNKVHRKYYKYDTKQSVKTIKPLHKFNNRIFYTRNLNDTIIEIKQDKLIASRVINYGKYKANDAQLKMNPLGAFDAVGDFMSNTRLYSECDNFIYFVFDYETLNKESPYYALYSKKTNKIRYFTNQTLVDDISFYPFAPQIKTVTENGEFVFPITALDVKRSIKRAIDRKIEFKRGKIETFIETTKDLKETDNPIVVLYKFKELK